MASAQRTHYELLNVAPDASSDEIKTAYRRLARVLHPDTPAGSAALFGLLTDAYDTLRDPSRRADYDKSLTGPARPEDTAPPPRPNSTPPRPGPSPRYGPRDQGGSFAGPGAGPRAGTTGGFPGWSSAPPWTPPVVDDFTVGRPGGWKWWTFPVVLVALTAATLVRFTGVTAALFGAYDGMPLLFGQWRGVPPLEGDVTGAAVALLVATTVVVGWYEFRRSMAPLPRSELVVLSTAVLVLATAVEFILVGGTAWAVFAIAVAAYGAWVWLLRQLPQPATTEHWQSFRAWWAAIWAARSRPGAGGRWRGGTQRGMRQDR